jgi:predicted TIM-barrel fold metal-dependent hydrolase
MDQGRAAEWLSNLSGANALMGGLAGRFDGHAHIFRSDLPMAHPRRYTPDYHAEPKTYCQHLQEHGLDGAILVQPSFLGTDNSYMLDQMAQMNGKDGLTLRAVVVLDPQDKSLDRAALADFSARGVIGLRLNVVGKSDTEVADLSDWESLVRLADQLGWHVELHCEGPRLAKPLSQLLSWSQQVVVDHFGLPDASNPLTCNGMAALTRASAEQLFVKCSAPYRVFPDLSVAQAAEQIKPVFTHLAEHLGPEHLLWGSDWPHTRFEAAQSFADSVNWMAGM